MLLSFLSGPPGASVPTMGIVTIFHYFIHAGVAVTVTVSGAPSASDTPRGTSGWWSQCPWGSRRALRWKRYRLPSPRPPAVFITASAGDS